MNYSEENKKKLIVEAAERFYKELQSITGACLYADENVSFYLRVPGNVQKPECEPNPSQVGAPGHYESTNSKFQWDGLETNSLDFIDWLENEYPQLKVLGYVTDCKSNELTKVEHDGFSYDVNAKKGDWLYKKDGRIFIESKPKISEHLYNNGRFRCCCERCDGDCGNSEYC